MEIPVISFEARINSLNNPSLISRFFSIFELGKLSHSHRLWKWGALFLALIYAFTSIINKIKILIVYYHNKSKSILASEPLLSYLDDEFSSDDDDDDYDNDDNCSTPDSDSDSSEEDGDADEDESEYRNQLVDEDYNVKGNFCDFSENTWQKRKFKLLRRRKSVIDNLLLSDFISGKGVVKLWDGLSLGVVDVNNAFSFLDSNHDIKSEDIFSRNSIFDAISTSPNVFISSEEKLGLNIWDMRTGLKSAAVHRSGKMVGIGAGKMYVRDDVTMGLSVSDVKEDCDAINGGVVLGC
ncbi:Fimbrial protein [Bienertia sinuspersici]